MNALSLRCIRAAFLFFAAGIVLGLLFAIDRSLGLALRPLHAELNLWGWVTLLTYGFAYHMVPSFAGRPIRWPRLAAAQSWMVIVGVALVAAGWLTQLWMPATGGAVVTAGTLLQLQAAIAFVVLMGDLLSDRS